MKTITDKLQNSKIKSLKRFVYIIASFYWISVYFLIYKNSSNTPEISEALDESEICIETIPILKRRLHLL